MKRHTAVTLLCFFLCSSSHSFVSTTRFNNNRLHLSAHYSDSADHYELINNSTYLISRRSSITSCMAATSACFVPLDYTCSAAYDDISTMEQQAKATTRPTITIPLQYEPKISAYTVSYIVGDTAFGAIVDTGSPFLVVPQTSCKADYKWGCYRPNESHPAPGLDPTYERFVGNEGLVEWREGRFQFGTFPDAFSAASDFALLFPQSSDMTFGVVSESLLDGTGGLFLGLVKETNKWIRPSFLGQSDVHAFSIDLREREGFDKSLTLYGATQQDDTNPNAIQLVRDLNKRYGDATIHYVGVASSLKVNGYNLASSTRRSKIYVIFDTGCSGMSMSASLFNERYRIARERKEKSLWGDVDIAFNTVSGNKVSLNARKPLTTTLDDQPWGKKLDGHLIVCGLAFLEGHKMNVDTDNDKLWFE